MHFSTLTLLTLKRPEDSTHKETRVPTRRNMTTRVAMPFGRTTLFEVGQGIIPKFIINFVAPRKPGEWIECLKKASEGHPIAVSMVAQNMHFPGGMPRISSCQPRLCTLEGGR